MSAQFLLRLCQQIDYVKEETDLSTINLTEIVNANDGSIKGFFGGAGGRYLSADSRRGSGGNMPRCHVTDVVVALWNSLESGDESEDLRIYKEMAPLFFF